MCTPPTSAGCLSFQYCKLTLDTLRVVSKGIGGAGTSVLPECKHAAQRLYAPQKYIKRPRQTYSWQRVDGDAEDMAVNAHEQRGKARQRYLTGIETCMVR